jgi:diaminopimelate epimerase
VIYLGVRPIQARRDRKEISVNEFVKSQSLGNCFVILDVSKIDFQLTGGNIRTLCRSEYGIGSDGVLASVPSGRAERGMRVFNADGSEAEMSGNGARILAKYLFEHGYTKKASFELEAGGRLVHCALTVDEGRVRAVRAELGRAAFEASAVPVRVRSKEAVGATLRAGKQEFLFTAVSTGNPHCVIFVDDLDAVDLVVLGPRIERHELFPARTNVEFVRVLAPDRIAVRLWERGVGTTTASGTGAIAASAAAVKNGRTRRALQVEMPGGTVTVTVGENFELAMEGPVEEVISGSISPDLRLRLTD